MFLPNGCQRGISVSNFKVLLSFYFFKLNAILKTNQVCDISGLSSYATPIFFSIFNIFCAHFCMCERDKLRNKKHFLIYVKFKSRKISTILLLFGRNIFLEFFRLHIVFAAVLSIFVYCSALLKFETDLVLLKIKTDSRFLTNLQFFKYLLMRFADGILDSNET